MKKIKSDFQKQCDDYMEGELEYLGIRKDLVTGYVTSVKKPNVGILRRLAKMLRIKV